MKRLFWLLVLLLGLPLLCWLAWDRVTPLLAISGAERSLQQRIAVSDPSVAYVLGKDRWTEFSIPNGTPSLRVVTNATLASSVKVDPTLSWSYLLKYEFLDSSGAVVLQRDYSYRSGVRQYQDPRTGAKFSSSFYLDPDVMPSDGHIVVLNLATLPQVARLRVKIELTDPGLRDVVLRLYTEEVVPDFRIAHRWLRLSDEQKAKLAKGNVFAQDLLAESEIRNLLRGHERPLGPTGISGRSYTSRTLYVMRDHGGQEMAVPVLPAGVFMDKNIRAIIALPEAGGKVRLTFTAQGLDNAPAPGSTIGVRWFGRLLNERSLRELVWRGPGTTLEAEWHGGLLEVSASGGLTVRAFLRQAGQQETEITPPATYLRAFAAQSGAPVDFAVDHAGNDPTPFRMDIRQTLAAGAVAAEKPVRVSYQLLNPEGAVVREGSLLAAPPLSLFDRPQPDQLGLRATDPSTYYFSLPAGIATVRLSADTSALVTGYTRPWDLVRESRVPEDAYLADDAMNRQVSWFPLKPKNFQTLVLANRSVLIATQFRPPVDNPEVLAGRYQWQDFHPQGDWLGRTLFTPVDDVGPPREDTLPASYRPLHTGQELLLSLQAPRGVQSLQPSLAYFRTQSTPFEVKVLLDGQLHYLGRAAGTDGEILLPALRVGQHRVQVVSEAAASFYLNYTAPVPGSLLKRLANRFERGQLRFTYPHGNHAEETLGLRLFAAQRQTGRTVLRVRLQAPRTQIVGPLTSWSFTSRRFDVRPQVLAGARVAAHQRQGVDQGQAFFIPLAPDLPAGDYPLTVVLEQGKGGYLLVSRMVPGLAPERGVKVEQELRHVQVEE